MRKRLFLAKIWYIHVFLLFSSFIYFYISLHVSAYVVQLRNFSNSLSMNVRQELVSVSAECSQNCYLTADMRALKRSFNLNCQLTICMLLGSTFRILICMFIYYISVFILAGIVAFGSTILHGPFCNNRSQVYQTRGFGHSLPS